MMTLPARWSPRCCRRPGGQTSGQLRVALRRAVIAADPEGAEQRRREAERHAKVSLYPDPEGTATLAATRLPGVHAAAGMARLTAIARAMKSAGMGGGLDYLRSAALIGLLLGTLPLVPPPAGDPGPPGPTDPDPGPPDCDPGRPGPGGPTGPDPAPAPAPAALAPASPARPTALERATRATRTTARASRCRPVKGRWMKGPPTRRRPPIPATSTRTMTRTMARSPPARQAPGLRYPPPWPRSRRSSASHHLATRPAARPPSATRRPAASPPGHRRACWT